MTRGRIIGAIVALVIVGLIIGGIFFSARNSAPEVEVAAAERDDLGVSVSASGKVEADKQSDVFPPTATTIEDLRVVEGQRVKAGQILAMLDKRPMQQQVNQAQAAYEQANGAVVQAQQGQPTGAERNAAAASVEAARDAATTSAQAYNDARETLGQVRQAASRGATTGVGIPALEAAVSQLRVQAKQAQAGYQQAVAQQGRLAGSSDGLTSAQNARDAAAENLSIARENLNEADLRAPISGIVIFNVIGTPAPDGSGPKPTEGAAVTPQLPPFTIVQLDDLRFNADVDEVDVPKLKRDMTADVTLDAFPGETFTTKVKRIQVRAVQTATGGTVFPVYLELDKTDKRVLIGMKGDATIETSSLEGALTVPVEAVLEDGDQSYVFVVEGEVVRRRNVEVGTLTDTRAQIESGIDEGDEVVVSGTGNLKDGQRVRKK